MPGNRRGEKENIEIEFKLWGTMGESGTDKTNKLLLEF